MKQEYNQIQREIEKIKARNKRVELDKAWEKSWTRNILIALFTYFLIVIFMLVTGLAKPFVSATIPTLAYLVSVNALPVIKKLWIKKQ